MLHQHPPTIHTHTRHHTHTILITTQSSPWQPKHTFQTEIARLKNGSWNQLTKNLGEHHSSTIFQHRFLKANKYLKLCDQNRLDIYVCMTDWRGHPRSAMVSNCDDHKNVAYVERWVGWEVEKAIYKVRQWYRAGHETMSGKPFILPSTYSCGSPPLEWKDLAGGSGLTGAHSGIHKSQRAQSSPRIFPP